MTGKTIASIDLGSNSCRLRVADESAHVLFMDSKATMLGEGLAKTGLLSQDSVERGLKAFEEFSSVMEKYHVTKYRAITTEACRKALNGQDFINMIKEKTGIKLEIIDAKEEARLNLKGASRNANKCKQYIVVYDLGGASTEISLAKNDKDCEILYTISIPWGARNAMEAYDLKEFDKNKALKLRDDIQKEVKKFIKNSDFERYQNDCCLIATSGTPLRLCAMVKDDGTYVKDKNDGASVLCKDFNQAIECICKMNLKERENCPYLSVDRAPIFVAACVIFKAIYDALGFDEMIVSFKGAQDAILEELCHG